MKKYDEIIRLFEQTRDNADDLVNFFEKLQEEEKQAKIKEETEKKKKERNPQLTDIRKTKYGYYL